jgi:hypothetical protein
LAKVDFPLGSSSHRLGIWYVFHKCLIRDESGRVKEHYGFVENGLMLPTAMAMVYGILLPSTEIRS